MLKKFFETRKKIKYLKEKKGWYRSMSGNLCDSHGCVSIPINDIKKMSWDKIKSL